MYIEDCQIEGNLCKHSLIRKVNRKHIKFSIAKNLGRFELAMSTNYGIAGTALVRLDLYLLQRLTHWWFTISNFYPESDSRGCGFITARQETSLQ